MKAAVQNERKLWKTIRQMEKVWGLGKQSFGPMVLWSVEESA
jgi:hypothetical protein